jgi:hypothetical protein
MITAKKVVPVKCQQVSCQESALSLSDRCWAHLESVTHYHRKLQDFLNALGDETVCLNLRKAELYSVDFSNRNIDGSCFSQAHLKSCHFIGANLSNADMIGSKLESCDFIGGALVGVNFTKAILRACSFSYTDLRKSCLVEAYLDNVDFIGAHLCGVTLWNAEFNDVKHLKRKNFQDPEKSPRKGRATISEENPLVACDSYRMLKHYLNHKGFYEDASWAAYRELTMERKYFYETRDLRYFPSLLMDLLSGYTAKPNRVIISSLGIIFFFALAYFFLNAAQSTFASAPETLSWMDALYFSLITFTTVGFGDLVPKAAPIYRGLVCLEAFSGPFMIGLYIFTLTRRYATN